MRGIRDFDIFFDVYLKMLQQNIADKDTDVEPFLIKVEDGGSISLNIPFAVDFFKALADRSETSFFEDKGESSPILRPHLGLLMNLVDAKICPGPLKFGTIRPSNPDFAPEFEKMNSKVKAKNFVEDDIEIATMTLGNFHECDECNSTFIASENDGHGVIARQAKSTSRRSFFFAVPHRQRR